MASIVIAGDTSGAVTIAAPATAGTPTLTLPTTSGTLVVTGGAQTIEFAAGSAASPSITFTGDTNTGIFSPAADTIGFSEGGVESMRIDSSGRVGINTNSPTSFLTINTGASAGIHIFRSDANANFDGIVFRNSANNTSQSKIGWNGNDLRFESTSNTLFETNGSERMRIDSSGNVGIGSTDGGIRLRVRQDSTSTTAVAGMYLQNGSFTSGTQTGIGFLNADNFNAKIYSFRNPSSEGNIVFAINNGNGTAESNVVERMRINASGDLLLNGTSPFADFTVYIRGNAQAGQGFRAFANGNFASDFRNASGTQVGSIVINSGGTAFNSTSDYRLKDNIQPMVGALDKVARLKPCTYTWKADGSAGQGFIAHELQAVVPDCVTGEKDAVDADGKPVYQGVDTSFLVATLTAAIQELNAKVEAQAAEIAALKGAN